jgi:hypothetical protein
VQLTTAHPRAGVHPHVAGDGEPPTGHARADELHAAQVALEAHVVVARSRDREELADPRALVAMPHGQLLDLLAGGAGEPVGGQHLGLERHDRLLAQRERQRHGTSSCRWIWNGPRLPP